MGKNNAVNSVSHPPVITIFIGGIKTIPKWVVYDLRDDTNSMQYPYNFSIHVLHNSSCILRWMSINLHLGRA